MKWEGIIIKIIHTELSEVLVFQYDLKEDSRGAQYPVMSKRELLEHGISFDYVEENMYCQEKAGTLYGIHFQNNPKPQAKLQYCIKGRGMDYAVDLRKNSPTYLKWISVELSAENRYQIYIPKGFGHAFVSLEDDTQVLMRIDEYFEPRYSRQIKWDDPMIGIKYPTSHPILAKHDVVAPTLAESDLNL